MNSIFKMSNKNTEKASESIINFLKSNVPKSDVDKVEEQLKKNFVLSKRRSKQGLKKKGNKKKSRTLTRPERKSLGFYAIPRKSLKYDEVMPMNSIWLQYISSMLELDKSVPDCNSKNWDQFTQTVYKADFHGSILRVVRSKCPSYVDKTGICIMDTRNTFKILSRDNLVTTIPKRDCIFEMYVNNLKITLFGKHLCVRPAERSTKKIKSYLLPDL